MSPSRYADRSRASESRTADGRTAVHDAAPRRRRALGGGEGGTGGITECYEASSEASPVVARTGPERAGLLLRSGPPLRSPDDPLREGIGSYT